MFAIIWIGFTIDFKKSTKFKEEIQANYSQLLYGLEETDEPQNYEITSEGELLNLQKYADTLTMISETTHVVTYRQTKGQDKLRLNHIDKKEIQFGEVINSVCGP